MPSATHVHKSQTPFSFSNHHGRREQQRRKNFKEAQKHRSTLATGLDVVNQKWSTAPAVHKRILNRNNVLVGNGNGVRNPGNPSETSSRNEFPSEINPPTSPLSQSPRDFDFSSDFDSDLGKNVMRERKIFELPPERTQLTKSQVNHEVERIRSLPQSPSRSQLI